MKNVFTLFIQQLHTKEEHILQVQAQLSVHPAQETRASILASKENVLSRYRKI